MDQVIEFAMVQAVSFAVALVIAAIGVFIYMWWEDKQINKRIKRERENMFFVHHPTAGDAWIDQKSFMEFEMYNKGWRIKGE